MNKEISIIINGEVYQHSVPITNAACRFHS